MELQFTNKQIFFALESIWNQLDYRFKYQINQLVTANDAEDYVQDLTIDRATLMQCYRAMSNGSYGCTVDMAEVLLDDLRTQLTTKGLLLPRMTTTQINAIASPAAGLTVYNTTLNLICFFDGTAWQKVTSSAM